MEKRDDGEGGRGRKETREGPISRPAARRRQHVHCNFYLVMKEGDEGEKEEAPAARQHGAFTW